ncbi:aminoglycoside 3'-phosphotransferase [Anopheles sinensis]|uniref:Aminoglycoside 3'-phosphotransferase n=1 Tax=Anopheles sinensis TaxID=74873 RepID=A0A084WS23_ANOSI|nr:aminoglycoside 3'-phosphotransferase [Anopheles sinensis]
MFTLSSEKKNIDQHIIPPQANDLQSAGGNKMFIKTQPLGPLTIDLPGELWCSIFLVTDVMNLMGQPAAA